MSAILRVLGNIVERIDVFPNNYAARISYGGQSSKRTLSGGCCTLLLTVVAVSIMTSYALPVYNNESPTFVSSTLPYDAGQ